MKPGDLVVYRQPPTVAVTPGEQQPANGTLGFGVVKRLATVSDRHPRTGEEGYEVDGIWIGLLPSTPEQEHFIAEAWVVSVILAEEVRQADYLETELDHVIENRRALGWSQKPR